MRHFSFRPSLTLRGRKFKGLRGFAGKPLHPPLTDIPVGAYMLVAAFDVISGIGHQNAWARDFYRAGTFTLVGFAPHSSTIASWTISTRPSVKRIWYT